MLRNERKLDRTIKLALPTTQVMSVSLDAHTGKHMDRGARHVHTHPDTDTHRQIETQLLP